MASNPAENLSKLRQALLDLHKVLLDSERATYETTIGTISSPNHFFQLATSDPWFTWLHPISELIVEMDEVLESPEPLPESTWQSYSIRARTLLVATETGDSFGKHYFDALQRDPDVVLAHADAARLFRLQTGRIRPDASAPGEV